LTKTKSMIGANSENDKPTVCYACGTRLKVMDRRRRGLATLAVAACMGVIACINLFIDISRINVLGFDFVSTAAFLALGIWLIRHKKRYVSRCPQCKRTDRWQ